MNLKRLSAKTRITVRCLVCLIFCYATLGHSVAQGLQAVATPAAPVLVSPGNGIDPGPILTGTSQTLRWNAVAGATSYRVSIRDVDTDVLTTEVVQAPATSLQRNLVAGHSYRWNMRAFTGSTSGDFSTTFFFQIQDTIIPPEAPTLIGPGNESDPGPVLASTSQTLRWNAVAGATSYRVSIRDVDTDVLTTEVVQAPTTSLQRNLVAGHRYRWNMRAFKGETSGDFSTTYYFQIEDTVTPPDAPTLIGPGNESDPGPVLASTSQTLRWNAVAGATSYRVSIRDVDTDVLTTEVVQAPATSLQRDLVAGHRYRWNMRAFKGETSGDFSTTYYFQIGISPITQPGFQLSFPLAGQTHSSASINSVFDHSMSIPYTKNDVVTAYTGERGEKGFGWDGDASHPSFKNSAGTAFIINGNYTGAGTPTFLNYDGHPGLDYRAPSGTPVYATADGVVQYPVSIPGLPNATDYNTIAINHGNGYVTYFLHCSTHPSAGNVLFSEGATIRRGERIATSGDVGAPGAPHLHVEVHYQGVPVDPYGWTGTGIDPYNRVNNINLWNAPPIQSTLRYSGSSEQTLSLSFLDPQVDGSGMIGTLRIENTSGTWVYIESALGSSVSLPYTVYLLGPGGIKSLPNVRFPSNSYLRLDTTTPVGVDFTLTSEKRVALMGALTVDLITRGLLTFALPADVYDSISLESITVLLKEIASAADASAALGRAIHENDIPGMLEAVVELAADPVFKDRIVELLRKYATSAQITAGLESLGFIFEVLNVPAKYRLLKELRDGTITAAPTSWSRIDLVEAPGVVPSIAGVSPEILTTKPLPQTQKLTITGAGFTSETRLVFKNGNETYTSRADRLSYINENLLEYRIAVGSAVGTWTVSLAGGTGLDTFQVVQDGSGLYTITPSAGLNGAIVPETSVTKTSGESQTFIAVPNVGYVVNTWTVNGAIIPNTGNLFTVTEIQANQSILVTFRAVGDTTPPAVTISSPLLGSTYVTAQTVRLLADASDNVAVSRVDFYNGPTRVASVSAPPYFYDWALSPSKNGTHTWTAKAYDGEGNFTISQPVTLNVDIPDVDVTPPTVTVLTPISGATFSTSTITLSGTAEDAGSPSSGIVVVEVRVRGEWLPASGTLTWSREVGLVLGGNVFEVRSRDGAGTYSDPKIIVVSHDGPRTRVIIDSEPRSIPILVDGKPTATLGSMELIVGSFHTLEAPVLHTSQEGVQYEFVNWSNNRPRQHSFEAQQVDATYTAHYRPLQVAGSNLGEIAIRDGAFQFELRASPGSVHVIEVSPDLKSWSPISTSTVPASSSLFFTARLGSEEEHNFFRAAKYAPALFVDSFDRPNSSVVGGRWIQSSENGMASIRSNALRLSATADQQAHIQSDGETHTGVLISFVLAVVTANQNQVIQIGTKGGGSGDNPYRNCFGFAILPGRGLQPNDTGFEGAITPFTFAEGGRYHVEIRIFANASRELRVWSVNDPRPAIATVSAAAKTVLANGTKYQIGFDAGSPLHTDLSIDDFRIALIE